MQRGFFYFIGILALGLGILGMAIPVLPTTPFLLLSGAMFLRSSDRMATWLFNHKVFGPPIRDYLEHKSVDKRSKILAMALLWPTILVSALLVDFIWLRILLVFIAVCVSAYILSLKSTQG